MKKFVAFLLCLPLLFQAFTIPASATVNTKNQELLADSGWSNWSTPVYSYFKIEH